jgi:hypothetical protein
MVRLLCCKDPDMQARACAALEALISHSPANRQALVQAAAVPLLVKLTAAESVLVADKAAGTLAHLADGCREHQLVVIQAGEWLAVRHCDPVPQCSH